MLDNMLDQNETFNRRDLVGPAAGNNNYWEIRHPVKCVCPKCGIGHVLRLPWSCGISVPDIYCLVCQETVTRVCAKNGLIVSQHLSDGVKCSQADRGIRNRSS